MVPCERYVLKPMKNKTCVPRRELKNNMDIPGSRYLKNS
jgi:hypothetical protein